MRQSRDVYFLPLIVTVSLVSLPIEKDSRIPGFELDAFEIAIQSSVLNAVK